MWGKFTLTAAIAALAMGCGGMEKNRQRDGLPADYDARSRGLDHLYAAPLSTAYLDQGTDDSDSRRSKK